METAPPNQNRRILIVDDNPAIHEAFLKILMPKKMEACGLEEVEAALFDKPAGNSIPHRFEIVSAFQGEEGIDLAGQASKDHRPFAMAFVDVRMPPGLNGIETTKRLWEIDPSLQVVICTAYSDYSFAEMSKALGPTDRVLILKKPFDVIEVMQMACNLTEKWELAQTAKRRIEELDSSVALHTQELQAANDKLLSDLSGRKAADARTAALASLGKGLSAAKTSKEAALVIVEVADKLIGWDACVCDLYLPERNVVQHVLSMDLVAGKKTFCASVNDQKPPTAFERRAIETGGFFELRDNPREMRADGIPFGDTKRPSASILFVPIRNAERVVGILSIQSYQPNAYNRESLETLQALADHCGGALDRIQSQEALLQTQEQFRQAQKMEAVGQLAGGVAHDFNNLLAVIMGNADLIRMDGLTYPTALNECLAQITAASERAAALARQLLTFSRKQIMRAEPIDLNNLVANLSKMLDRIIGEQIALRCYYGEQLPLVNADAGMIEQVLMNLAVNARDAMPQGGSLEISTGKVHFESHCQPNHPDCRAGDFVCLSVKDTGIGIAPEHLPHLFEPFFTTKEAGKGTGLGLATAYGIVKQHRGWIEVSTKVGHGSTFTIFLSTIETPVSKTSRTIEQLEPGGGNETILLVEDEVAVRAMTRRVLEKQGYRVLESCSGRDALRVWDASAQKADLLLTDVIMPDGLNGWKLAQELVGRKPDLKVIYVSGYTGDVLGQDFADALQEKAQFLQKPFSSDQLLRVLRQLLSDPAADRH